MSYHEFAYYYDRLMEDMPYDQWCEFANKSWDRFKCKPTKVVDLGCGTGSISIPLAQQGYQITGIDLSSEMLSLAKQKHSLNGSLSIRWLHQNMIEWALPYKVDSVISFCDSLNYLLEEDQVKQTFHQVYEGLHSGGTFIFDVHTVLQLEEYALEQPFTWNEEDLAYIWNCTYDSNRCEIEHELTIFAKEASHSTSSHLFRKIEEVHTQRAYSIVWLQELLQKIGFTHVECLSDFTMNPITNHTKRAFFIAIK